jgi:hypothetical protein
MEMYRGLKISLSLAVVGDDLPDSLPVYTILEKTAPLYWEPLEGTSLECSLVHHLSRYTQSLHADTGTVP